MAGPVSLDGPQSLGLSPDSGALYFSDAYGSSIDRVDLATGAVSQVTFTGRRRDKGVVEQGASIFNYPMPLALIGASLYISEQRVGYPLSPLIRVITLAVGGIIVGVSSLVVDPDNDPFGIALDGKGSLYMCDQRKNAVRKINLTNGQATASYGDPNSTDIFQPYGIAIDQRRGYAYVSERYSLSLSADGAQISQGSRIRSVNLANGAIGSVAGAYGGAGFADGAGTDGLFNNPFGLPVGPDGNLYVADTGNNRIRIVNLSTYEVTTLAGADGSPASVDGFGSQARFDVPMGIAVDNSGVIYVAERGGNRIRKVIYELEHEGE